ncbi:MAG: hypothetical protein P0S93_02145 [Candidatus Neptunochlamydia sp.]|nr:hypothetical protein [Candidatus Neptunochlamydia sp.]
MIFPQEASNTSKEKGLLLDFGSALLKGGLSLDKNRITENILGLVASKTAEMLPEGDKSELYRAFRATATNPDLHGYAIKKGMDYAFKKSLPEVAELSQEKVEQPVEKLTEKIAAIKAQISKQDEVISIGQEHLNNLHNLRKDWRVYIDETGRKLVSMEKEREAEQALEKAKNERSSLEQTLQDYQKLLPAVEMRDKARYLDLVREEKQLKSDLHIAEEKSVKKYQSFKNARKKKEDYEESSNPFKAIAYEAGWTNVKKDCNKKKASSEKADKEVAQLKGKITANKRAQQEASAPKELPPMNTLSFVVDQRSTNKKNHHLSYVDDYGVKQSLGKYKTKEAAEYVSGQFTKLIIDKKSHEYQCYDAEQKLIAQGVPKEKIPSRPYFNMPTTVGNNASKNGDVISQSIREHNTIKDQYMGETERIAQDYAIEPLKAQGLTNEEKYHLKEKITPHIKNDPKKHSIFFKVYRGTKRLVDKGERFLGRIGFSGEINVGSIDIPAKTGNPSSRSTYGESRHQITVERSKLQSMETVRPEQRGNWNDVERFQNQRMFQENMTFRSTNPTPQKHTAQHEQMFERNMAYQPPVDNSKTLNYQQSWGQRLSRNVQMPPSEWSSLGRNNPSQKSRQIQTAGLAPNEIIKATPDQIKSGIDNWVKNYAQEIKDNPIKSKKDMGVCLILGAKKIIVVAIQAFEQPSLKTRPNSFGLMEVSDRCDRFVAQKLDVALDSSHAKLGMLIGEVAMPIPFMGVLQPCMKVGKEAFAFMRQANKFVRPQPLIDQALVRSKGFGQQVRAIKTFQQPALRSGFASKGTAGRLTERQITRIKPMEVPDLQKGADLDWFAKNSPRINQLRNLYAPKHFYRELSKEFRKLEMNELNIRRTLKHAAFKTYLTPKGIPIKCSIGLSKLSGGMIYRKMGTTEKQNIIVRVMPGKREKNLVTAFLKGERPKWSLRQGNSLCGSNERRKIPYN